MAAVATDDLSAPLGKNAKTKRRIALAAGHAVAVDRRRARTCAAWIFAGWALVADDPLGGEPMAVIATGPLPKPGATRCRQVPQCRRRGHTRYDGLAVILALRHRFLRQDSRPRIPPPGTKTVTIIDGSGGQSESGRCPAMPRRTGQGAGRPRLLGKVARTAPSPSRRGRCAARGSLCRRRAT